MVQKSSEMAPINSSNKTRARTPDSMVWKSTKARNLVSGVRFSWDKYQKLCFVEFLETVGLGFKNADLTPLLVQLNLDGYENIENDYGESVYELIEEKVRRKLNNTAGELGAEKLKKASFRPKMIEPTLKEGPVTAPKEKAPSRPPIPQIKLEPPPTSNEKVLDFLEKCPNPTQDPKVSDSVRRDTTPRTPRPPQQVHPLLKMPKPKAPIVPNSPSINSSRSSRTVSQDTNFEPNPIPRFNFQDSGSSIWSGYITPQSDVKSEYAESSIPAFEFRGSATPKKPTTSNSNASQADDDIAAKRSRAKRSIGRLVSMLQRAESALEEVERAFEDLPPAEGGTDTAHVFRRLRSGLIGAEVDAEELEDFATTEL